MEKTRQEREALAKVKQKSKTKQSFAKEADINIIVERMAKGQHVPDGTQAYYADVSNLPDDLSALLREVTAAKEAFFTLDPKLRAQFDNDPAKLLDFVKDPANLEKCQELGLIPKPEKPYPKSDPQIAEEEAKAAAEAAGEGTGETK